MKAFQISEAASLNCCLPDTQPLEQTTSSKQFQAPI